MTIPYGVAVASTIEGAINDATSLAALLLAEDQRLHGIWTLPTQPPPPGLRPL